MNKFVYENDINSITEYGCGDGNQLAYAEYPQYIGLDISNEAVKFSSQLFLKDASKKFYVYDPNEFEINQRKFSADLVLSLDVIYHLVEDEVYRKYLENVFNSARKYVVIYSSNEEIPRMVYSRHVRHRNFTRHIEEWFPDNFGLFNAFFRKNRFYGFWPMHRPSKSTKIITHFPRLRGIGAPKFIPRC